MSASLYQNGRIGKLQKGPCERNAPDLLVKARPAANAGTTDTKAKTPYLYRYKPPWPASSGFGLNT